MDSSPCDELCQGNRRASRKPTQVEKTEHIGCSEALQGHVTLHNPVTVHSLDTVTY